MSNPQGAKKVSFTACHLGKLWLTCTSLSQELFDLAWNFFFLDKYNWLQFFRNINSPKHFTCPLGKLRTETTSPRLGTTFFACWIHPKWFPTYDESPGCVWLKSQTENWCLASKYNCLSSLLATRDFSQERHLCFNDRNSILMT